MQRTRAPRKPVAKKSAAKLPAVTTTSQPPTPSTSPPPIEPPFHFVEQGSFASATSPTSPPPNQSTEPQHEVPDNSLSATLASPPPIQSASPPTISPAHIPRAKSPATHDDESVAVGGDKQITIKKYNVKDITPKVKDPEVQALMPTNLRKYMVAFELHGVNSAIANGIRRTILSEMLVKVMTFKYTDFTTTDPYILNDFVLTRIRCIPIKQSVNPSATFSLAVENNSDKPRLVKSAEIKDRNGKSSDLFNETFDIIMLGAGKKIAINNIHIEENYGYINACHTLVNSPTCKPLDVEMYNPFDPQPGQIHSSESNPAVYEITFRTNDTQDPKKILIDCCANIIDRLSKIQLSTIKSVADIHTLTIYGETDTIGNLLVKTITEIFPDIPLCTYRSDYLSRKLELRIRNDTSVESIMESTIKKCMLMFTSIKSLFEHL